MNYNTSTQVFPIPAKFVPWLVKKEDRLYCDISSQDSSNPSDISDIAEQLRDFPERFKRVQEKVERAQERAQRAVIIAEFVNEAYNGRGQERD